jgi:hypothetical protein
VAQLKAAGGRSAWVPGVGLSAVGFLLAHLGLDVVVTDLSEVAVEFQLGGKEGFPGLVDKLGPPGGHGTIVAALHDMRTNFRKDAFDLIVNVKAISGFQNADMRRAASVHAAALRGGRSAYFDTLNVQGGRRDDLEQALESGGFLVPYSAWNRSYRRTLRETGIPHNFILGQPVIPISGEYVDNSKRRAAMTQLREIELEYRKRLDAEGETERARIRPSAKVAHVIYNTG